MMGIMGTLPPSQGSREMVQNSSYSSSNVSLARGGDNRQFWLPRPAAAEVVTGDQKIGKSHPHLTLATV